MIKRRILAFAALLIGSRSAHSQRIADVESRSVNLPSVLYVQSLVELKALKPRPPLVFVGGRDHPNDGVGGFFRWTPADVTAPDDALCVSPNEPPAGRYKRVFSGAIDAKWFGAKGDGLSDDTQALQAAIDHCATDNPSGSTLLLPSGDYRITAPLVIRRQYFQMQGDGMWRSRILFNDVAGGGLITASMRYLRPVLRDFALMGNTVSGRGVDFSRVRGDTYAGELKNLSIEAGEDGLYANRFFSMTVDNVFSRSHRGHSFRVECGPAVGWRNCYAVEAGPGKAGYRLSGIVALYSCNGVNRADYWGVFGCDPTATDGFQDDFPERSHADVTLIECNIEDFCSGLQGRNASAIMLHSYYRQFNMIGGKIDRSALSTPYHSVLRSRKGPNAPGSPIRLSPGSVFLGKGAPTTSHLYSDGKSYFADEIGSLSSVGIRTWREGGRDYAVLSTTATVDPYGQSSTHHPGLSAGLLMVDAIRFNEAVQPMRETDLNTLGRTVVVISNDEPTTINTIGFRTPDGATQRPQRSSLLIVQVEDDWTTFKHQYDSMDGLRMKSDANYRGRKGDVLVFVRSNYFDGRRPGWVQV